MAAIAAQFNPDGATSDEILTFYNDQNAQLGFELVPAISGADVTFSNADDLTKGFIKNPSQLAAIHFERLVSPQKAPSWCVNHIALPVDTRCEFTPFPKPGMRLS